MIDAKMWTDRDLSEVDERDEGMIAEAQRRFEVGEVYEQCGSWAVTDYGVECLTEHYPIPKDELYAGEPDGGWMFHMADKRWVNMSDFGMALQAARFRFDPLRKTLPRSVPRKVQSNRSANLVGPKLRYQILKRDGYRCQLCGNTAAAGARLHVDHKRPVATGGSSHPVNLWTLCSACNLGKGVQPL